MNRLAKTGIALGAGAAFCVGNYYFYESGRTSAPESNAKVDACIRAAKLGSAVTRIQNPPRECSDYKSSLSQTTTVVTHTKANSDSSSVTSITTYNFPSAQKFKEDNYITAEDARISNILNDVELGVGVIIEGGLVIAGTALYESVKNPPNLSWSVQV